jgi:hypothetical protein
MTRVIGKSTQSRIWGSRYRFSLLKLSLHSKVGYDCIYAAIISVLTLQASYSCKAKGVVKNFGIGIGVCNMPDFASHLAFLASNDSAKEKSRETDRDEELEKWLS